MLNAVKHLVLFAHETAALRVTREGAARLSAALSVTVKPAHCFVVAAQSAGGTQSALDVV
jgi:hypothetical protein